MNTFIHSASSEIEVHVIHKQKCRILLSTQVIKEMFIAMCYTYIILHTERSTYDLPTTPSQSLGLCADDFYLMALQDKDTLCRCRHQPQYSCLWVTLFEFKVYLFLEYAV